MAGHLLLRVGSPSVETTVARINPPSTMLHEVDNLLTEVYLFFTVCIEQPDSVLTIAMEGREVCSIGNGILFVDG
jgi:hypothetical protein